jgi:hypothetical protein
MTIVMMMMMVMLYIRSAVKGKWSRRLSSHKPRSYSPTQSTGRYRSMDMIDI